MGFGDNPFPPLALKPADRQFPLQDGDEIYRVLAAGRASHGNKYPDFTFEIAFGEGEIVEGEPLIPTLAQFVGLIEGVVEPFRPLLS
ncbi:MAG: hypothetical protein A2133_03400 [Actinobacteria bacterium RBG_16_64_13]|nr:MAG: hypothetical protein A2133_03400 [Actinobacteria bacterium RBG_16_64_13]